MGLVNELQQLEQLRTQGALTAEEYVLAKSRLLAPSSTAEANEPQTLLADQLAELRLQNQLSQVDREWDREERRYQIGGSCGRRYIPTILMGLVIAVSGSLFGLLWVTLAIALPDIMRAISPYTLPIETVNNAIYLIGIVLILASLFRGIRLGLTAFAYNHAYNTYLRKRQTLVGSIG